MVDTGYIKEQYDLRHIVEQDLGKSPIRSGQASLYKCPFHNERKGYSLAVWADGYRCFGKCDTAGDVFDWLMTNRHLSFVEALACLGESQPTQAIPHKRAEPPVQTLPPPDDWQESAWEVVDIAEECLWSHEGERALTWLLDRGLTSKTIQTARLGYIAGGVQDWRKIAGLNVPCGITIPWFAADALWAVKVRRAAGDPKYVQIAGGSAHGLYNADSLLHSGVALFCEGEFDVLLVQQEADELVSPVTLGSATTRLTDYWYGELIGHRTLLVAYDNDTAGKRGTERLLRVSPRFRELALPGGQDVTDFYLHGGDIHNWIAESITLSYREITP